MRALVPLLLVLWLPAQAMPVSAPLDQAQRAIDTGHVAEAVRVLQPLARQGHEGAQWALARLLELPGRDRDLKAALHWYLKLADKGSSEAMEAVGLAYYLGRGVAENPTLAAEWFRQAGERGEMGSQYLLASMYETGLGLPKDLRLARAWYARAADQGDAAAAAKRDELDRKLDQDDSVTAPP